MSDDRYTDLDFIHNTFKARDISSVADFEIMETYEDELEHYRNNKFSYIPLPYSEKYYDIEEDELKDFPTDQVIFDEEDVFETIQHLVEQPFLFIDSYGKRVIDQPDDGLPYRYESGKIEVNGEWYGPRQAYNHYGKFKEKLPEERHSHLFDLANERHRYWMITLPDINRRPLRTLCYQLIMQLETRLADLIKTEYESEDLFEELNHETLGLWKQDEIRGNQVHITEHMNSGELIKIIRKDAELVERLGFQSKTKFSDKLSGIVNLRHKVMHPTRTLAHDREHLDDQKERLERLEDVLYRLIDLQEDQFEPPYADDIELPDV